MNKKEISILIAVCFFIFAVRFLTLSALPFHDEYYWVEQAIHQDYFEYTIPHPPLAIWAYNVFYLLSHTIRLLPLFINILTFIVSFLILREFTKNKQSYYWFYVLYGFLFWNVLSSMIIDTDGFMSLFTTAAIYFYIKFEKTKNKSWYILAAITFGMSLLTKVTGLFILMILGSYVLIKTKSLKKSIRLLTPFSLIGAAVFSIFPLLFYKSGFFSFVITRSSSFFYIPTPAHLLYLIVWGTPLLLIFLILSYKIFTEENMALIFWIVVPLIMYFFGVPFHSPFDRYLIILIPPLLIVGALLIPSYIENKKTMVWALFFIFLFVFLMLDKPLPYIQHNFKSYFMHILAFKWGFLLPITGTSGPAFGMPVVFFMVVLGASLAALIFILCNKNAKGAFILALSLCLAFNVFNILQLEIPRNQPDIDAIKIDMIKDMQYKENLYSNEKSFRLFFPEMKVTKDESKVDDNVFIFDYPPPYNLERWQGCGLIKEYSQYNQTFGYHFKCD